MACPQTSELLYLPAVAHVVALLSDQDAYIRGWMLGALGTIPLPGDPMHTDLVKVLSSMSLDNPNVILALGNSKDISVVPALIARLDHKLWGVRKCAVLALGKFSKSQIAVIET
jgi:hypothetical protein